ncbi:MAG: hypothetical protein FWF94_08760 [Oscillospiraceae bacterium]|nr:hypothetical protein [Oscillospiraceae bacterium]
MTDTNKNTEVFELKLKKPHKWENQTYTSLSFDFGKLNGNDYLEIEREMFDSGELRFYKAPSDPHFLTRLAAKAGNVGSDVIKSLPLKHFSAIQEAARRFLIYTESETEMETEESEESATG